MNTRTVGAGLLIKAGLAVALLGMRGAPVTAETGRCQNMQFGCNDGNSCSSSGYYVINGCYVTCFDSDGNPKAGAYCGS